MENDEKMLAKLNDKKKKILDALADLEKFLENNKDATKIKLKIN